MKLPKKVMFKSQMQMTEENRKMRKKILNILEKGRKEQEKLSSWEDYLGVIYIEDFTLSANEQGWEAVSEDGSHEFRFIEQEQNFFRNCIPELTLFLRDRSNPLKQFYFGVKLRDGSEYQLSVYISKRTLEITRAYYRKVDHYFFRKDANHRHETPEELKIVAQKIDRALREFPPLRLKMITSFIQTYYF